MKVKLILDGYYPPVTFVAEVPGDITEAELNAFMKDLAVKDVEEDSINEVQSFILYEVLGEDALPEVVVARLPNGGMSVTEV